MARCPDCGQKDCCGASMSEEIDRLTAQLAEVKKELTNYKLGFATQQECNETLKSDWRGEG